MHAIMRVSKVSSLFSHLLFSSIQARAFHQRYGRRLPSPLEISPLLAFRTNLKFCERSLGWDVRCSALVSLPTLCFWLTGTTSHCKSDKPPHLTSGFTASRRLRFTASRRLELPPPGVTRKTLLQAEERLRTTPARPLFKAQRAKPVQVPVMFDDMT